MNEQDHLKTLRQMRSIFHRGTEPVKAIDFAISAIERNNETRELLEAADAIQFGNLRFVRGAGYCWISNEGDETVSLLDAFKLYREVKKEQI